MVLGPHMNDYCYLHDHDYILTFEYIRWFDYREGEREILKSYDK